MNRQRKIGLVLITLAILAAAAFSVGKPAREIVQSFGGNAITEKEHSGSRISPEEFAANRGEMPEPKTTFSPEEFAANKGEM